MIPDGLLESHFRRAAVEIDRYGVPKERKSVHYDLLIGKRFYPPKYVISVASRIAHGKELASKSFNAVEAKKYFEARGYTVRDRRKEAENVIASEDDESEFPEGHRSFEYHRRLERDGKLPRKAKAKRLAETGRLECEVCGIDFFATYGERGKGFIEAHHTKPVASLCGTEKTKISELAMVCSNCHRMLHRGSELMSISELRAVVSEQRQLAPNNSFKLTPLRGGA